MLLRNWHDRENSPRVIARSERKECTEGCGGMWKICAEEILANNQVPPQVFRDAVCDLPIKGRGKYRNIMINGNANCGKTFLYLIR